MQESILTASGTVVLAPAGVGTGPQGWQITVRPGTGWSGSLVFKTNTAPPGAATNYVSVAYQNPSTGEEVAAGTAVTAAGAVIISPTAGDLAVTYTHTAGRVTLIVRPATSGVTNSELATAFVASGYSTAGQVTPLAMLSAAVAGLLGQIPGAVGDGETDDTAAIAAAANTHWNLNFGGPQFTYRVSAAIPLRTGQRVFGTGATIQQVTANTEIFNIEAKSNVWAWGLRYLGVGSDYSESDSNRSVAFYGGTSGSGHRIFDNTFENFGYASARFQGQTDIAFHRNRCIGPGSPILTAVTSGRNYGVLFDAGCSRFDIADNDFSEWAQGVRIEGASKGSVTGGSIFNIRGQHGIYIGADCSHLKIDPGLIDTTPLCGVKVQTANTASGDNDTITVGAIPMRNIGTDAVLFTNGDYPTAPTKFNRNVTVGAVAGKTIGQDGLNLIACRGVEANGFAFRDVGREGISLGLVEDAAIGSCLLENVGNNGVRDINTLTRVRLHDIRVRTPGVDAVGSDNFGMYLSAAASEYVTVEDCDVTSANANMEYGLIITGGTQSTFKVRRNTVRNANTTGARFVSPATTIAAYEGNDFSGTSGPVTNEPIPPTVASAATITLPANQGVVRISGTTTITSIVANGHSGRTVRLIFLDVLTLTDGSNLKMNGNFVTSADDTWTGSCDGTDWFEDARSPN